MARTPKKNVQEAQAKVKERTEAALRSFLQSMETGTFPAAVAKMTILSRASDAPSAKWSAGNQALMILAGTMDARGYRQWQEVGRQVKKGAQALYICRPNTITKTETDEKTGEEVKRPIVVGFAFTPVFRVEDTEGAPLPAYDPPALPPLVEVAEAFGVSVKYAPPAGDYGGYYTPGREEIVLCSHSERVFFHELAHAAHYRLPENAATPASDTARKEIVAETVAAALCRLYGYDYGGTHARYIAHYAEANEPQTALREIMRYIGEVRDVLDLILTTAEDTKTREAAA